MDELILVDLCDREKGHTDKTTAHREGKLHRAFSVFLTDGDRMLIQKRNINKYHSGGLWANACCSHPRFGETLEEAVCRRTKEELGISVPSLHEIFSFVYFSKYDEALFEYEYDHVFIGEYSGEIGDFDRSEIGELEWVGIDELEQRMLERPQEFASWFMIAAPRVIKMITDSRGD